MSSNDGQRQLALNAPLLTDSFAAHYTTTLNAHRHCNPQEEQARRAAAELAKQKADAQALKKEHDEAQRAAKAAAEAQKAARERAQAQAEAQARAHAATQAQGQAHAGFGAQATQYGFSSSTDQQQSNEIPQWATESYNYLQPQARNATRGWSTAQRASTTHPS